MSYSFDTSIFTNIERNYPRDRSPRIWNIFESRLSRREIFVSREVIVELSINPTFDNWIENNYPDCIIETTSEIQNILRDLINRYPNWIDPHSTQNFADPFIIAVAIATDSVVVSQEKINRTVLENPTQINNHPVKIPNICILENIEHLDLVEFLLEIGDFT